MKDIQQYEAFVYHGVIVNLYFYQRSCSNIRTNKLNFISAREYIAAEEPDQLQHYILRPACDIFLT